MSCVQEEEHKKEIQEMFTGLENGSGEVDFTGFMLQVGTLALICKHMVDSMKID